MGMALIFKIAGIGIGSFVLEEIAEARGDSRLAAIIKIGSTVVVLVMLLGAIQELIHLVKILIGGMI